MPPAAPLSADQARQAVLAYLQISRARGPAETGPGPVLVLRHVGGEETWSARLWGDAAAFDAQPRPPADRWFRVDADGTVTEEPVDNQARAQARRRTGKPTGRPRKHPEGKPRPRRPSVQLSFTPEDEAIVQLLALAQEWNCTPNEAALRLVREGLERRR